MQKHLGHWGIMMKNLLKTQIDFINLRWIIKRPFGNMEIKKFLQNIIMIHMMGNFLYGLCVLLFPIVLLDNILVLKKCKAI